MPDASERAYESQPPNTIEALDAPSCSPALARRDLPERGGDGSLSSHGGEIRDCPLAPPLVSRRISDRQPMPIHVLTPFGCRREICQRVHANHHNTRHDPSRRPAWVIRPFRGGHAFTSRLCCRVACSAAQPEGHRPIGLAELPGGGAQIRWSRHRRADTAFHRQEVLFVDQDRPASPNTSFPFPPEASARPLTPHLVIFQQVGCGTPHGCRTTIHCIRRWLKLHASDEDHCVLTMDLWRAFNQIDRFPRQGSRGWPQDW